MSIKDFDPEKFIDREFETELFENLLLFNDQARVLAIRDKGGMGKSQLLAKLVYRCQTVQPNTRFSFIDLHQLEDKRPFGLVKQVAEDLREIWGVNLSRFFDHYFALQSDDFEKFRASIYLQGAIFTGAQGTTIIGTNVSELNTGGGNAYFAAGTLTMTPKQQELAERACLSAFFDDLRDICKSSTVVLMLDTYEKCEEKLGTWIDNHLLDKHFFDLKLRPARLLLVVAGREIPAFERRWATEDVQATVSSVKELGKWKREHVEKCLKVHGFIYTAEEVETFYRMVQLGMPPSDIVNSMQIYLRRQS